VEAAGDASASLAAAVHFGRHAAQLVDAEIRGVAIERLAAPPRATRDRIRFDHHPKAARARSDGRTLTVDEAIAEARRCLACGGCLECDNCWKFCPDQAVIKPLERGQPYRFRLEFCQGCSKCAEECPTGYIEMR
jgi:Pyruvate/2-oxoacid:ferredoxin oxidoreductase delta subunit